MPRTLPRLAALVVVLSSATSWSVDAQQSRAPLVTSQDLLDGFKDPTRWLTHSGDYTGQRHSPLTQITPQNVARLAAQWTFQTNIPGHKFEATPVVFDSILYLTGPLDTGWAIDARSGRAIWSYRRELPQGVIACCGLVNTGFGVLGDRLFKTTLDAHVLALDIRTGAIVWDTEMANFKEGYAATRAPLIVKDKVIVGMAGGEYGVRGFIDAYEAQTGKRAWRFYTTAGPGDPGHHTWKGKDPKAWEHGGGATWGTGTYDPELNLVYWGTGNPGPDYDGSNREGDNLYTSAVVALDADTGKLRWHYQFSPHDTNDWDANQFPVLADLTLNGQPRKVVMIANRNGFFYVLDRANGKVLLGKPYINTSWAKEIGPDGRPIVVSNYRPSEQGTKVCPAQGGGSNWQSPAFAPALRLFFVNATESCAIYYSWKVEYKPGESFRAGSAQRIRGGSDEYGEQFGDPEDYSVIRAIDPATGTRKWEYRFAGPGLTSGGGSAAGMLSTASGLLFSGGSGNVMAFDAKTGKVLWHYQTGAQVYAAPTTYMLDGRQHVLIPSGSTLTAFALPQ